MVVGLDLHELVELIGLEAVAVRLGVDREDARLEAGHDRRVVLVGRKRILRTLRVGVLYHLEQRLRLLLAVDDELGAEDLVAAVLGIHLPEHHKLGVCRVATCRGEALGEILHLRLADRKADLLVGLADGLDALRQHVVSAAGLRLADLEKIVDSEIDALGHLVVERGISLVG